jgi:hypothetical protein
MLKEYRVYLKGGGNSSSTVSQSRNLIPDENPTEAKIADEISQELVCPFSYHLMIDPVVISSGKTFDRTSIMNEFDRQTDIARQRDINHLGILFCPFTREPLTDVLTPNLQMRSITEKFFYRYKDVKYKGSTWDEIRRLCRVYQEEQTPEKIQQRRDIHNIEEAKRAAERIKKRQQEDRMQEQEQLIRAQQQGMRAQEEMMQEMENRIHQLEQILEMGNAAGVRIPRDERDVIQLPERPPDVPLEVYERLRLDRVRADREFNFDPRTVAARFQKDLDMYRRFLYGW